MMKMYYSDARVFLFFLVIIIIWSLCCFFVLDTQFLPFAKTSILTFDRMLHTLLNPNDMNDFLALNFWYILCFTNVIQVYTIRMLLSLWLFSYFVHFWNGNVDDYLATLMLPSYTCWGHFYFRNRGCLVKERQSWQSCWNGRRSYHW